MNAAWLPRNWRNNYSTHRATHNRSCTICCVNPFLHPTVLFPRMISQRSPSAVSTEKINFSAAKNVLPQISLAILQERGQRAQRHA